MAKKQKPPAKGKSRGKSGKGSRYDRVILIGIIIAAAAIGLSLWGPLKKFRHGENKMTQAGKNVSGPKKGAVPERIEPKKPEDVPNRRSAPAPTKSENDQGRTQTDGSALVAIVIDDLGVDLKAARELISLPARITVAVMPGLPQSRSVSDLAKRGNREILLHLPMEHRNGNGRPAPGMLRSDMTPMNFLTALSNDVESVPGAVGVNNHEGSLLTENAEAMKFLMAELKARNLMFLDSMTSAKSVAYSTAREFGLKAAKRDVFLDNNSGDPAAILSQLEELGRMAKTRGRAVGIGHPHPATITALRKWIAEADRRGITIVPLSRLAN